MTQYNSGRFPHIFVMVLSFAFCAPTLSSAQSFDGSAAAAAEVRFQQLEKEIRRLTGLIEEQNYEIRRLRDELSRATGDLEVRITDLEGGVPSSKRVEPSAVEQGAQSASSVPIEVSRSSGVPSAQPRGLVRDYQTHAQTPSPRDENSAQTLGTLNVSPDGQRISSHDTPAAAYDHAYSFIKVRDFESAEREFSKFMQTYPDHPLMSNAKYWYAETFYVRGDYQKSARLFAEGYQQYPKAPKAASNLLKLGMSLTGMGKKEDACIAYKQLKKDYSKSSVPVLKRAEKEMERIQCL